ncbi:PDDEXK family nuclease [Pelosinus propionicus]|uniref:Uncharacterized protein n=1 Tax=Pelosinus propionicus DSM 13327 TaxID=1123291 RepID=A0A1I4PXJ3_9FIRM|nr:hypothetical protein [Pelosinus propionicus]SFM32542.1 hypothetical protein SAMN04490355_107617 [Pelosinus propionicus DSM 13327]
MDGVNKLTYELSHTARIMEQFNDAFKWIKDKNLKIELSRYSRYKRYIDDFYNKGNPEDILDLEAKFAKLNEAAQECIQMVQVYEAFKEVESNSLDERIEKIVSGQDFYNSVNRDDQPRDFLYELLVAAMFKKNGYEIDFEQLTDVVAKKNNKTIYIECKRIKSDSKLEQNFSKACKQLNQIDKTENTYRLVFIDVYNCFADKLKDYEYNDVFEITKEVKRVMAEHFGKPNNRLINRILDENIDNILGVVFTCTRCLWLSKVSPQFYIEKKVITPSKISDENFQALNKILSAE